MAGNLTLVESVDELHKALAEYIEATYHVSNPTLVEARRRLLNEMGVIRQAAYIESTPKYITAEPFERLGIPEIGRAHV